MEIARIVLEFIGVLIWPTVVLVALFLFKNDLTSIFTRLRKIKLPGGTEFSILEYLEFEKAKEKVMNAENEKNQVVNELLEKVTIEKNEKEKIQAVLEEKNHQLRNAYNQLKEITENKFFDENAKKEMIDECISELTQDNREFIEFIIANPNATHKEASKKFNMSISNIRTKKKRVLHRMHQCFKRKMDDYF